MVPTSMRSMSRAWNHCAPYQMRELMILGDVHRHHELAPHQTLVVSGAVEFVRAAHIHLLVGTGAGHELHLGPFLVRGGVDDAAAVAKRHGVILALLSARVAPRLARAPEHRLVSLGYVEVGDEDRSRARVRDLAERAVAALDRGEGGERERWASSGSARRVRRVRLAVARRQGGAPRDERRRREVHSSHPFVGCRASRSCCDGARGGGRGGVSGRGARFQNRWRSRRKDARRRHAELFGHVVLATPQAHPLARVVGTGFLELLSRRHGVARHRRALWHRGATADGFSYECERPSLSMA